METSIFEPIVQYGFAGMAAVQLGVIVWMHSRTAAQYDKSVEAQIKLAEALQSLSESTKDDTHATRKLHEKMLARPCIAQGE